MLFCSYQCHIDLNTEFCRILMAISYVNVKDGGVDNCQKLAIYSVIIDPSFNIKDFAFSQGRRRVLKSGTAIERISVHRVPKARVGESTRGGLTPSLMGVWEIFPE